MNRFNTKESNPQHHEEKTIRSPARAQHARQGKTAPRTSSSLEKEFAADGITVEQVQRLERREFAYPHEHLKSAYYVNFNHRLTPAQLEKLRAKLKLDAEVTLQNYLFCARESCGVTSTSFRNHGQRQ